MNQEDYGKAFQRRIDLPIACLLAAVYLASMLWSQDPGYCRDEIYYFRAGKQYITWIHKFFSEIRQKRTIVGLNSTKPSEIRNYWAGYGNNHEHPPLAKILMGASWWFFTQQWRSPSPRLTAAQKSKLSWAQWWRQVREKALDMLRMPDDRAFRFPGMCWASLIIFLLYIWGTQAFNRRVGLFAALAMMLLPRFFFHAHLAAFDVPISALWFLVVYAFWRGMKSSQWGVLCGIFFGLALATKHNSWILPFVLGLYWLGQTWNKYRIRIHPDGTYQVRFPPMHGALFSAMLFGPLLMIGLWPLLWPTDPLHVQGWTNTWKHLGFYFSFHLKHNHYDAYYFHTLHMEPPFPWHFPFVMTLITFPLASVILSMGGMWFLIREQRVGTHLLWWFVWFVRTPLWSWILAPLLSLILSLAMLLPALVLSVFWVVFKVLELIGQLLFGGSVAVVPRGLGWLRASFGAMLHDLRQWNPWMHEDAVEREYRARPVGPADKTGMLWLLNALIPIAIIALPSTPIFGGTKHWMPAWPFLALMAGLGFDRICQALQRGVWVNTKPMRLAVGSAILAVLFLSPALIGLVRSHPHGLAYYNTLIGGPRGSANWGMQRSFWAPSTKQALPWLNAQGKIVRGHRSNIQVDFHDSNASHYYRQFGWLRPHVHEPWFHSSRSRPYRPGDYIAFVHQKWLRTQLYHALILLHARAPTHGVYLDEAPLITIWERNSQKHPVWW